jgi:hypothetical protein
MLWLRKGVVYFLSLVLLLSLLGVALATGADSAFSHPNKIEAWLSQSNIYSHFVAQVTSQAQQSTGGNNSSVALTDVEVQQAAKSAFNTQLLQQDVNVFIDSNYAWLEGKTSVPDFNIDLGPAKQTFAQTVGSYVATYLNGLPVCSPTQLAQLGSTANADPLSLSCRPATLDPQTEGTQIAQQLSTSTNFLSDPVLTANNISPTQNHQVRQPYYQRLSQAPRLYRAAVRLPVFSLIVALLSALGIVVLAVSRRRGVRRIGEVLLVSGIVLVAIKFIADAAFKHLEDHIFNTSSVGQLQQSLTDFGHHVESQLVKVDLWFGIAFLVLAIIIIGTVLATRQRMPKTPKPEKLPIPKVDNGSNNQEATSTASSFPTPPAKPQPPRPKPPKLIQ